MVNQDFTAQTKELIDNLKGICANYGLGNTGDEYKIITQAFLYKFMNDKFGYEVKQIDPKLKNAENWEAGNCQVQRQAIRNALIAHEFR